MNTIERRHYRIEGSVQGVGFRWWTARLAREAGLRGTVRNLADGAVEVEVVGSAVEVARFREALRVGPRAAEVRAVRELPPGEQPLPDAFEIRG